jgi:membrane protease YdiL (CAAX protease family)
MTQPPFWQPAEDRPQFWRTALGLALVVALWIAASIAVVFGAARLLGRPAAEVAAANTFATASAYFLTFLGFHIGLALVLPLLHRRGYTSLFGPARRLTLRHYARGAGVTLGLAAALYGLMGLERLVLPAGVSPPLQLHQPPLAWLAVVIPALALIAMQTLAEEALFRGYLLQQLRARFRSPLIWAVLPSLAFGALHYDAATYGAINASAYVLNAAVLGTLAAFITLRTGNLAAAAGLHFGNNAALVAVGLKGNMAGFSLFVVELDLKSGYTTYSILTQTAVLALAFGLWWRWMARHRPIANAGRGL